MTFQKLILNDLFDNIILIVVLFNMMVMMSQGLIEESELTKQYLS